MAINGDEIIHGGFVNIGKLVTNGMTVNYSSKIIVPFEPEEPSEEPPSEYPQQENNTIRITYKGMLENTEFDISQLIFLGVNNMQTFAQSAFYTSSQFNEPPYLKDEYKQSPIELIGSFTDEETGNTTNWDDEKDIFIPTFGKTCSELDVIGDMTFSAYMNDELGTKWQQITVSGIQNITAIVISDKIPIESIDLSNCTGLKNLRVPPETQVIGWNG